MPGLRQPVDDAVVAADPVEQHLPALTEPVGELLTVIGQHLLRHPELAQRGGEGQAYRPAGRANNDLADHAVPGMVIHPGHDLRLGAAGQECPAHDVDLPQCHRCLPLPSPVDLLAPPAGTGLDQTMTDQRPVGTHPRRHR